MMKVSILQDTLSSLCETTLEFSGLADLRTQAAASTPNMRFLAGASD